MDLLSPLEAAASSKMPPSLLWLRDLRERGAQDFKRLGLPTKKWEDWRHTRLKNIENRSYKWPKPIVGMKDLFERHEILPWIHRDDLRFVFLNGHYCHSLSQTENLPEGVILRPLSSIFNSDDISSEVQTKIRDHIQHFTPRDFSNPFMALNLAYFFEASVIWVHQGVQLDRAIHIVHISEGENLSSHSKSFIVLEKDAEATVTETHFAMESSECLTTSTIHAQVGTHAQLHLVKSYSGNESSAHFGEVSAHILRDGGLNLFGFSTGGASSKHDSWVELAETGAQAQLCGIYLAKETSRSSHQTTLIHKAPQTVSRQIYKGILADSTQCSFHGKIVVEPDCPGVEAHQLNKNLLLSPSAEVDTRPQLEIATDDVKCTHGATIGQLSDDELFYFQSRGIDRDTSVEILSRSFVEETLFHLPTKEIRDRVHHLAKDFFCNLKWTRQENA